MTAGVGEVPKSVLARGLMLLDAFATADSELTLAELAHRTGLPKATAHRLVAELVRWGGLERSGHAYRLGIKLFELGQRAPRRRDLREAALPYLQDLYESTHENIHLAVPDGVSTLFLEKVTGHRSTPILSRVGSRMPMHCTATGKIFLALGPPGYFHQIAAAGLARRTARTIVAPGLLRKELDRAFEQGYGVNREESEVGVAAVAAPVYDARKRLLAAISITGSAERLDLARLAPAVRTAAFALSRSLAR
ncbi:IclR family transcriptional regulator [Amycolatopsis alkalitolerans]|uniref:Glycerol operon regulatory protein n=1 Tax=Amycolatopsis alkalitolerans TaxID=2547244 RepID=A0A5C4M105_9PSEU|nr:IclR family transcriptional regulator [Amycolatopsis alkalitolerans]TNC24385.1 IclR family transcriptional regulator [Amycolatopsis alkalitolerans]